jgi:hypothetical protein
VIYGNVAFSILKPIQRLLVFLVIEFVFVVFGLVSFQHLSTALLKESNFATSGGYLICFAIEPAK